MNKMMYIVWSAAAFALCLSSMVGMAGCAKKNVRHLASDVCLVAPEKTTKQEVFNYLGKPNEEYETPDGNTLWVYYEVKKSMLRETPYVGEKIGAELYEVVKVSFYGDIVQSVDYRSMEAEDFKEGGLGK
jgi:hypothetical protein